MVWRLMLSQVKKSYVNILRYVSCCDLCGETVGNTVLFDLEFPQTLLCQYCINDLPYFNQKLIGGNLLTWPAIHRALPQIHFDQLFSFSPYIYPFNQWLAQIKYSGRFELARLFSELLCAQWQATMINKKMTVDLVLSVPLHVKKWQLRGYNQAHIIAKPFADKLSLPYDANLVVRIKDNESQMGKTGSQRRKNLTGAFSLQKQPASHVKHVVLIDDVITTGTTASEISKLLKKAGVETVTLITVCLALPHLKKV